MIAFKHDENYDRPAYVYLSIDISIYDVRLLARIRRCHAFSKINAGSPHVYHFWGLKSFVTKLDN